MASADRISRYQSIVNELTELTELIGLAGDPEFLAREKDTLTRVHEQYFAAVTDLTRSRS